MSLARKMKNWASGTIEGKQSAETLNDIEALSKQQLNAAKTTYRGKVGGLNALGAKFATEPIETEAAPAAAAAPGRIIVRAGDGSTHPFASEAEAKKFEDLVKQQGGTTTRR